MAAMNLGRIGDPIVRTLAAGWMSALLVACGSAGGATSGDAAAATSGSASEPVSTESVATSAVSAGSGEAAPSSSAGTSQAPILLADHDATVYTDSGEARTLTSLAEGRPLVINFWATWCPYCVEEMPDFQEILADYGDRVSFAFVDSVDEGEAGIAADLAWLEEKGFDLPVFFDTKREAATAFDIWSLPTTVIVSAGGEVISASPGRIDPTIVRGALATLV